MRGTAFIVSRKGANENALNAARGALRESGKLIICLSLDDIFDMLEQLNPVHFFGGRSLVRSFVWGYV
jgi:tRNA1(Val) A37 N6-methylase TrmN6